MPPEGDETDRLRRWHENVANGSQVYADVSERRLRAFCTDSGLGAAALAALDVPDLRRALEDYLAREKKRGHSGEYIRTTLKAIRSWRVYNNVPYVEGLKVPNSTLSPRLDVEQMPTPQDLHRTLLAARPREAAAIAFMAFSGCRPQALGNYEGTDGLRLGDLPELVIEEGRPRFTKVPTLVRVRAANSKAKHGYFTFLGAEGCDIVIQYLEERRLKGEKLVPGLDLIHPEKADKAFVRALNIGDGVRRAMRAAGLDQRPYVWRSYFLSRLLEAANAGKVSDRYVEFWAGHRGDVTARHYTTGRPTLAASMVEDMRSAYERCESYLSTVPSKREADAQSKMARVMLMGLGYSEKELAKVDFENLDVTAFRDLVTKKMGRDPSAEGNRQRVVDSTDLPRYLQDGWRVVTAVNGHQVVVDPPGRSTP